MSSPFLNRLHRGPPLLADGAMGSELIRATNDIKGDFARFNLSRPDLVLKIHRSYVAAGAQVILTNTFQANPLTIPDKLELQRIGQAAVDLARQAQAAFVLADIGPIVTGKSVEFSNPDDLRRTVDAIPDADAILLETCSSATVLAAIEKLRAKSAGDDLPILLSLAFWHGHAGIQTRDGHEPEWWAARARDVGVAAIGVNCGVEISLADCKDIVGRVRALANLPVFARPNAGTCKLGPNGFDYPRAPKDFAAAVSGLIDAGAALIGGCCGTTPEYIRAMRDQLISADPG